MSNSHQKLTTKPSQFTRKKIENYSYGLNDVIGKGYSSHVYKGRNDENGNSFLINRYPSRRQSHRSQNAQKLNQQGPPRIWNRHYELAQEQTQYSYPIRCIYHQKQHLHHHWTLFFRHEPCHKGKTVRTWGLFLHGPASPRIQASPSTLNCSSRS